MALIMRGPAAELRIGHEVAACLGKWELTRTETGFYLTAGVIHRNMFWLTAGYPIDLSVSVGRNSWRWRNVQVSGDDPLIVSGTGRPEVQ